MEHARHSLGMGTWPCVYGSCKIWKRKNMYFELVGRFIPPGHS